MIKDPKVRLLQMHLLMKKVISQLRIKNTTESGVK